MDQLDNYARLKEDAERTYDEIIEQIKSDNTVLINEKIFGSIRGFEEMDIRFCYLFLEWSFLFGPEPLGIKYLDRIIHMYGPLDVFKFLDFLASQVHSLFVIIIDFSRTNRHGISPYMYKSLDTAIFDHNDDLFGDTRYRDSFIDLCVKVLSPSDQIIGKRMVSQWVHTSNSLVAFIDLIKTNHIIM